MKNYDVWFAEQLKKRENGSAEITVIGVVESTSPLIVSIEGGQINLDKRHLYITQTALNALGGVGESAININDNVLLLTSGNGQKFFLIDKVRKVV